MSIKTRNVIAVIVGAVAALAVIAVIVLSCITISPASYADGWMKDYSSVNVFYGKNRLPGENADGKLVGNGEASGKYSYDDLFSMMNFSLFSACLQFNYDFGLGLKDSGHVDKNKLTVAEVKAEADKISNGETEGYSFIVRFDAVRTLTLKDNDGRKAEQKYDTVIFTFAQSSDWARNIDAYAFVWQDLYGASDDYGVASEVFYKLKFGAKTSSVMDTLDDIYDVANAPSVDDEEGTEGEEETAA